MLTICRNAPDICNFLLTFPQVFQPIIPLILWFTSDLTRQQPLRYDWLTIICYFHDQQKSFITRKQSEPADLRQGHVVRQVAASYSVWQRFPLCPIESNVNENFKVIQNPGFLPDHPRNWITGSLCHSQHTLKISERSVHNFLSYLADTQTNKQTNKIWQKHNLLGEGNQNHNYHIHCRAACGKAWCSSHQQQKHPTDT